MKKAIITFGVGYGFDDIKYFIHSCHLNAPDVDLFIFVGKNIQALRQAFKSYPNVHFVRYRQNFIGKVISKVFTKLPLVSKQYARLLRRVYFAGGNISKNLTKALTTPLVQFMVKRFFIIEKFLRTLPHEYIMLSDMRDVVIQGDPFQSVSENAIVTGIEPVTNQECKLNSKWIKKTYSEEKFTALKNEFVACAGVTIGSRKAVEQYVKEMMDDVFDNLDKIVGMLGADQAIHIRLFYQKLAGLNKHFEANGEGSIATLHFSNLNEFVLTNGRINNRNDEDLAVVHQYDRHAGLAEYLRKSLDESIRIHLKLSA